MAPKKAGGTRITYMPMGQSAVKKPEGGMAIDKVLTALKEDWTLIDVPSFEVWASSTCYVCGSCGCVSATGFGESDAVRSVGRHTTCTCLVLSFSISVYVKISDLYVFCSLCTGTLSISLHLYC